MSANPSRKHSKLYTLFSEKYSPGTPKMDDGLFVLERP